MKTLWFCEYSPTQKCAHVDTAERCCKKNQRALKMGRICGYYPIAAFESEEEALSFAAEFTEKMRAQEKDND